jgi:uncharacterized protein (TIGR03083 family)
MTPLLPFPELLDLIAERSATLRQAVATGDPQARVPGCPDWSLHDLVAHLGAVQRWWAHVVTTGPADSAPPFADGDPAGDLVDWSAESTRLLIDALRVAGPDRDCWTWWGASEAPMTSGAVARHQVQEAAVHAWDAQQSVGKPEPIPAAVAVDTIDELLVVTLGSLGAWPHRPARIALSAVEGPTWLVDLTPSGAKADPSAGGEPLATIRGAASDLVLTLYKRIPLDDVEVDGDREAVEELLTWTDTE